jgi:Ca2+-binding RTX toxin-like protein
VATIVGTAGNDTLAGTSGDDTISGLGGNDLVLAGSTGGADVIDGGTGFDSIEFKARATSAVVVDFAAGMITGGSPGTISFSNIERVVGGNFNDRLSGNAAGQTLTGLGGADTLWGAGGVDNLWGGAGVDTFIFRETGTGNADSVRDFASGSDKLVLDAAVMRALGASGNFAAGDARFVANSSGTAQDASDRVIYETDTRQIWYDADGSGAGARQLIATLQSGATLVATDIAVEGGSNGGGQTINGTPGNDSLVGGAGDDTINGLAGNDTLRGLSGNDSLDGGEGNDVLDGGEGDDTLISASGFDTVDGGAGFDTEITSGGIAGAGIERMILRGYADVGETNGHGNELDNTIIDEGAGVASLYGNGGNDSLIGGSGVNFFAFSGDLSGSSDAYGHDSVDGGGGIDRMSFSGNSVAVTVDFRAGTVTGGSTVSASVTFVNVEGALGTQFNDVMIAGDSGNELGGYEGNDTLTGGAGDDGLSGDSGFDHPPVNPGNDRLSGGAGNDGLGGDEGDDWLDGGTGNDDLFGDNVVGGGGADSFAFTVAPGASNADRIDDFVSAEDRIVLDGTVHANSGPSGRFTASDGRFAANSSGTAQDSSDRVVYNTSSGELWYDADGNGAGSRQLIATLVGAPTLGASNMEVINGSSGGGSTINGTSGNDALTGTSGNDTLNGLGGNDTLVGSGGTDFYDGGTGFDTLDFRGTTGIAISFSAGTVTGGFNGTFANVERALGSNVNDSIDGGAGGQTLAGQGGADTLWGAAGVDTLWGGGGADTFIFRETGSANADSVRDWASGTDKVALDDAAMSALGASGNFSTGDARFWSSTSGTAHDANDRVIYNTSTGSLYYDADGSGAGAVQLIATFAGNPAVAATDIVVI